MASNQLTLLTGFGVGLSWGSALVQLDNNLADRTQSFNEFSVVIPCFKSTAALNALVADILSQYEENCHEIILVQDGPDEIRLPVFKICHLKRRGFG